MGVGKTTVAKQLSHRRNLPFVDLDSEIERTEQSSISEIFARQGEGYFRKLESKILSQISDKGVIVSTGGGIVGSEINWRLMREKGKVIYLHASWPTISARLVDTSKRPLAGNGVDDKLHSLWESRLPLYNQADVIIDTDNRTVKQVVDAIVNNLDLD